MACISEVLSAQCLFGSWRCRIFYRFRSSVPPSRSESESVVLFQPVSDVETAYEQLQLVEEASDNRKKYAYLQTTNLIVDRRS